MVELDLKDSPENRLLALDTLDNLGAFNIKYRRVNGENQCKLCGDVTNLLISKLVATAPAYEAKVPGQYFRQGIAETSVAYEQLRESDAGIQHRLISTDSEPDRIENRSVRSETGDISLEPVQLQESAQQAAEQDQVVLVEHEQVVFDPAKVDNDPLQVSVDPEQVLVDQEQIRPWQCGDRVIGFWMKGRVWRLAVVLQVNEVNLSFLISEVIILKKR